MSLDRARALVGALLVAAFAAASSSQSWAQARDAVRPEVGKPLQAAQALVKARRGREALGEIAKAEAVPSRTPYENFLIAQMKGSAANAAGDYDTAIAAFESVLNSGRVSGREATEMVKAIAVGYYQKKDYARSAQWAQRYFKEGGSDGAMRTVLLQSYYLGNDCGAVSKMLGSATSEESSRRPSEEELQILANCYLKQKDKGGYFSAMERLVAYYPKKEYWTSLLADVQRKPGFSDRLSLQVYRLRLATGNLSSTNDYMEMAQLALQAGFSAEAKMVVDKGYAAGALGAGKEAERHARLRDLVTKSIESAKKNRAAEERDAIAAQEGDALVKLGMNDVFSGHADKGLALMEQGVKKGNLRRPEDAKLQLGIAQVMAGQRARGVQTLRAVKGADGTADLAQLWVLQARA